MTDPVLITLGIAACSAVVALPAALYARFNRDARALRALRTRPTQPLAEIADGAPGRFTGVVEAFGGGTINAPISGKPCVLFQLAVFRTSGGQGTTSGKVFEDRGGTPFVVRDDSGRAVVDPSTARVVVEPTETKSIGDADALEAYLAGKGFSTSWFLSPAVLYREVLIEVGETVHVFGAGTREPDPDGAPDGYRGAMPTRLRVADSPQHRLVISDDPRARST